MISYDKVKENPRVFRAFTGLDPPEFEKLLTLFERAWHADVATRVSHDQARQRQVGGGRKPQLVTLQDKLFFILFYLKTYPLQEVIAFLFGLSQAQANTWIHRLSEVLQVALALEDYLPERDSEKLASTLTEYETLEFIIDGTERRKQRPQDNEAQKRYYSGKRKAHTLKNNVIVHADRRTVCYLSQTVAGKKHDKKLADDEGYTFPANSILFQDTGFQGFNPERVIVLQPKKKPKGKALSVGERMLNRLISSARMTVENVIAGIKRCRIVKEVFRNTKRHFDDLVMELACGDRKSVV